MFDSEHLVVHVIFAQEFDHITCCIFDLVADGQTRFRKTWSKSYFHNDFNQERKLEEQNQFPSRFWSYFKLMFSLPSCLKRNLEIWSFKIICPEIVPVSDSVLLYVMIHSRESIFSMLFLLSICSLHPSWCWRSRTNSTNVSRRWPTFWLQLVKLQDDHWLLCETSVWRLGSSNGTHHVLQFDPILYVQGLDQWSGSSHYWSGNVHDLIYMAELFASGPVSGQHYQSFTS